jgi:aminoglycoside phosphotransferase (APT) family kinase protein
VSTTDQMIDKARAVREGEELDAEALGAYLEKHLGPGGSIEIEQFPGGHSNLTYLVRRGDKEYVLRRPPFGSKVKSAHDMSREVRVLSKLSAVHDWAPRPLLFCQDPEVLGADFYLMERIRGVILRKQPPKGLTIDEPTARALSEMLVDTLAQLHNIDLEAVGLGDFGRPAGYIERQISGWTKRYHGSKTDDIPEVIQIADWLAANLPPEGPPGLIHNDFKYDNMILDPEDLTVVRGVLDWEMCTVGDPLMDLGTSLSYWVQADDPQPMQMMRFGPTTLPGMMTRDELVARYAEKTGRDVSNIVFFYCYGLFKTAVVVQQIYYRFATGKTSDPRFASLSHAVALLCRSAVHAAETGTLATKA